jgi:phospholipid transport system substrate-binding protein
MTIPVRSVTRRAVLGMIAASVVSPALAADQPSLAYMKHVARDLLNANRLGTVASFRRAIQRHADVGDIAIYSLGPYKGKLPETQRHRYYGGVATFMARYFADQSREYRVAKYELGEATDAGDDEVLIPSTVYLMSGQSYTVNWRLARRGGRYKIVDTKVLGFSLVYLQRSLFTSYLSKRNGDVGQLVAALNR